MENTYNNNETISSLNPRKIKVMKAKAREQLIGNYGPIIGATLLILIISTIASNIVNPMGIAPLSPARTLIYYAAAFIILWLTEFFYVGLYHMHLNAARGKEISIAQLAFPIRNGSNRFLGVSFVLTIISFVVVIPNQIIMNRSTALLYGTPEEITAASAGMTVMSIATCIVAIVIMIIMLGLSLAPMLMIDNPSMNTMEALSESWRYMKGNKWKMFVLALSFIGLCLLGLLSFGIAYIWITPYMQQSTIVFYETVVQPAQSQPQAEETDQIS